MSRAMQLPQHVNDAQVQRPTEVTTGVIQRMEMEWREVVHPFELHKEKVEVTTTPMDRKYESRNEGSILGTSIPNNVCVITLVFYLVLLPLQASEHLAILKLLYASDP